MRPIFELPSFIESEHQRRTHNDPQLVVVLNGMRRGDVHVVHHELRVLSRDHVEVGQRRRYCDALVVAAQVEFGGNI